MPGTMPNSASITALTKSARGYRVTCSPMSEPRLSSDVARVTIIAAPTEMMSAGICETRPSPTVSRV